MADISTLLRGAPVFFLQLSKDINLKPVLILCMSIFFNLHPGPNGPEFGIARVQLGPFVRGTDVSRAVRNRSCRYLLGDNWGTRNQHNPGNLQQYIIIGYLYHGDMYIYI